MIKPDLDAIRKLSEQATQAPWKVKESGGSIQSHSIWSPIKQKNVCSGISPKTVNAQFIAHARTDIPALLDYIKELHQEINTLEKSLDDNFKGELVAKNRLQLVNAGIDSSACKGAYSGESAVCQECSMEKYCEERKA